MNDRKSQALRETEHFVWNPSLWGGGVYTKVYHLDPTWTWVVHPSDMDEMVLIDQHGRIRERQPIRWHTVPNSNRIFAIGLDDAVNIHYNDTDETPVPIT